MNILVDIGHPAHVHFFKNAISIWREHSHNVSIATRHIKIAEDLLKVYGLGFDTVSQKRTGTLGLGFELAEHTFRLLPLLQRKQIDVCVSIGGTFMVYAGMLAGAKRLVFYDTEIATASNRITYPFATRIITPDVYPDNIGSKHIKYNGFHELAYLHPNYFTPDPQVLQKYRLSKDSLFSIVRYISWEAAHDLGLKVASQESKRALIKRLEEQGRVLLVHEDPCPSEFRDLNIKIRPEDFHHLLYYASCCVTEGATTASEACLLGTPSLYINPVSRCYIDTMATYGILEKAAPGSDMLSALACLLDRFHDKSLAKAKAEEIVSSHCDVTAEIVRITEEQPLHRRSTIEKRHGK